MKYKVGDKVKIKSLSWYNSHKTECGDVYSNGILFVRKMSEYCGKKATIVGKTDVSYKLDIDSKFYYWTDKMFEENINDIETKEIIIPQGWEIDKVEGNKLILKEGKKELPKTWEECIKQYETLEHIGLAGCIKSFYIESQRPLEKGAFPKGLGKPMLALMQLLVCREVYRQGWKPDWTDANENKYCIVNVLNKIKPSNSTFNAVFNKVLSFQSEEIRDKFLENFKDLIEEAKELI